MTHWNLNGQITNGYSDEKHSINYHKISKLTVLHYSKWFPYDSRKKIKIKNTISEKFMICHFYIFHNILYYGLVLHCWHTDIRDTIAFIYRMMSSHVLYGNYLDRISTLWYRTRMNVTEFKILLLLRVMYRTFSTVL